MALVLCCTPAVVAAVAGAGAEDWAASEVASSVRGMRNASNLTETCGRGVRTGSLRLAGAAPALVSRFVITWWPAQSSVPNRSASEWTEPRAVCPSYYRSLLNRLDAGIGGIGPFQLYRVAAKRLGFPCADVPDFTVRVVVPAGAWNGIGDGFAQFVR